MPNSPEGLAAAIQSATGAALAAQNSGGATASADAAGNKNLLNELQSYLSGLQTGDGAAAGGGGASAGARNIDLAAALSVETVGRLADDGERASALVAHLPTIESEDSAKKQLKDTVASPQFRQALSTFSTALQSGQLGPVVSQFQLDSDAVAAANSGDLEQFVKALEKKKSTGAEKEQQPMEEDKPSDA